MEFQKRTSSTPANKSTPFLIPFLCQFIKIVFYCNSENRLGSYAPRAYESKVITVSISTLTTLPQVTIIITATFKAVGHFIFITENNGGGKINLHEIHFPERSAKNNPSDNFFSPCKKIPQSVFFCAFRKMVNQNENVGSSEKISSSLSDPFLAEQTSFLFPPSALSRFLSNSSPCLSPAFSSPFQDQ